MGQPKILVVDDERHIVRLIQVNLERQGYEVITAFDGQEAFEKIRSEKPDVITLDIRMPKLNGIEVLQAVRKGGPEIENIPIIILSNKAEDKDIFEGYHHGADVYLTKPFNPHEVMMTIKKMLGIG